MNADALDGMMLFVAVAETRSFRVAGERLGVSASAVSQALRKLEARLGVTLVHRTTRSVALSAAGERLYRSVRPAVSEVEAAVAAVGELSDEPRGTLRLLIGTAADTVLTGPMLVRFLTTHPHIRLDLVVSDDVGDIVTDGYDGAIQIGETIDRDMVAVPVTDEIRMTVVGSPAYFARRSFPRHPRELVEHECLNWHQSASTPAYRWEFTEPGTTHGREFAVVVPERVLSTDASVLIHLARAGMGLTIVYESQVREYIERGELIPVLEEFCEPFPGYFLFYPQHRHASPALRALISHLQASRLPDRGGTRLR